MLERILYSLLWLLILGGIGYAGYFGYTKLNHDFVYESGDGDVVVNNEVEPIALNFGNEIDTGDEVSDTDATSGDGGNTDLDENDPANLGNSDTDQNNSSNGSSPEVPAGDHSALIGKIERLITDYGKTMKVGSQGTRVGTVQELLNLYHGTSDVVDNQYGNGTKAAVQEFQEMQGLASPDGLAGPATYQAMIDWLEG